ncbi:MAG: toprim domain-containing protein [Gammaproteobacteria bacterium]|nr:toprim domain-containing protein [Gammaproteobacteria bacterium]
MSGTLPSDTEVVRAFAEAMAQAGLPPPEHIKADGRLHRFPTNGQRSDDAGYYILHLDGMPAGYFGCWRSDVAQAWHAERGHGPRARRRGGEAARRQAEARVRAAAIWKAAELDCVDHPYLVRKGINPYGVRRYRGELVIGGMSCDGSLVAPGRDGAGLIQTLQFIHAEERDGDNKRFLPGGVWKGHYFGIGKPNGTLCIAEGYATGASIHAATGQAVAIAFNAANLEPVARALRNKFPAVKLCLCADNDLNEEGRPNAGVDAARRAAAAVGGLVAVPELGGRPCDFNDLCRARGLEAVNEALRTAQAVGNGEAQPERGSEQAFDREVGRLAELHPRRYERERADAAKQLKVRAAVLDQWVRAVQRKVEPAGMGTEITFDEPAPSPHPVDGAALLEGLTESLHAHVKMSPAAGDATALWVVHTHAHAQARISPILCICSPEKRCGKSTLLSVLSAWVRRPLPASNISVSAICRPH